MEAPLWKATKTSGITSLCFSSSSLPSHPFALFFPLLVFVQGLYAVVGYTMRSSRSLPSAVARQAGAPDKGCTALLRGP